MSRRGRRILGAAVVALLFILHNEQWLFERDGANVLFDPRSAVWGWFPADMAYHVIWVVLAAGAAWSEPWRGAREAGWATSVSGWSASRGVRCSIFAGSA